MNSYLFYDIETTGLNKCFDQILQFAAIRTDLELNELERYQFIVQVRPDVIPSPYAMITHQISIMDCMSGLCEYEAIKEIHKIMNAPGTISLGYNTLTFDDEFLRFSFYRNLLTPYTHQFANGCKRMDLLPITLLYWQNKNDIINWPEIDGKTSMKLEHISSLNKLAEGQAHDAMVDVEATLALARIFYQEREMWDYIQGYFDKQTDTSRILGLPVNFQSMMGEHRLGLAGSVKFGVDSNYIVPVLSLGASIPYKNQSLWLRLDLSELKDTKTETIQDTCYVLRKRSGESPVILPPVERFWNKVDNDRDKTVQDNLEWIKDNPELFSEIVLLYRNYKYPDVEGVDIDAKLYIQGFMKKEELKLCDEFHAVPLEEKPKVVRKFGSSESGDLASRIVFRNYPEFVVGDVADAHASYFKSVNPTNHDDALVDFRGEKRVHPSHVLSEISDIKNSSEIVLGEKQQEILGELRDYIEMEFHVTM